MEKIENGNVFSKAWIWIYEKLWMENLFHNELGNLKLSKGISVVENFNYSIFD